MFCKTAIATFTGSVISIVFAGGLASGFVGPAAAAECPAGGPVPYGLIGDTWRRYFVKDRIGCPTEPEHDVPGRKGRLQTFQKGQIAWTPDQGPRMTIWAIRDKAHFHVRWSTNEPTWSYDKYLIRWDRDGHNLGQREISGTTEGWWDFDFNTPGTYTFIVEGRSGGGYHHGWTIPVGGTIPPSDIPPPNGTSSSSRPLPPPNITVGPPQPFQSGVFVVQGSGFLPSSRVNIRVADDAGNPNLFFETTSSAQGTISTQLRIPCQPGALHFSANDGRPPINRDVTGNLWSNTVTMNCQ